jgi:hypothetical protein
LVCRHRVAPALQPRSEGDTEDWEEFGGRRRELLDAVKALDNLLGREPWQTSIMEALIEHGEEQGTIVHRRLDADPRAILGIELARPKAAKPERIKAAEQIPSRL